MAKQNTGPKPFRLFSKLFPQTATGDSGDEKGTAELQPKSDLPKYKLLFFIVDWNQIRKVSGVLEAGNVAFHFINKGRGTASSEILDLLGIGANDKAVIIGLCHPESILSNIKEVRKKLNFHSPGAGIAFAVPLSAANNPLLKMLARVGTEVQKTDTVKKPAAADENAAYANERRSGIDRRSGHDRRGSKDKSASLGEITQGEYTHALIIIAVNQGYSDELMIAARAAGAVGGTVLYARGRPNRDAIKFLGISVQEEREIILILSNRETKDPIMKAILEKRGPDSKAQSIIFSLPAENVIGLSYD